jgi:iron complex outermembrane receptor protein
MVPGLYVTRINADWWSVSARGFGDYLNNKMLVLVDGRSLYDSQFGGVDWDQEEIPLEQIDRIEVIRGPGGTLWGANAVNGVINIITKSADQTQGFAVATFASAQEGYTSSLRFGGKIGTNLSYRLFGLQQLRPASRFWSSGADVYQPRSVLCGCPRPF